MKFVLSMVCPQYKETAKGNFKFSSLPCINEPSTTQVVNNDILCPRDSFHVKTQICSTKLTQNGTVVLDRWVGGAAFVDGVGRRGYMMCGIL